jgi:hypothetical protein
MELHMLVVELSFRYRRRQTRFHSARMGVDIETYRVRIFGSEIDNETESGVLKERQESFPAKV